jgi:hypothetical protein
MGDAGDELADAAVQIAAKYGYGLNDMIQMLLDAASRIHKTTMTTSDEIIGTQVNSADDDRDIPLTGTVVAQAADGQLWVTWSQNKAELWPHDELRPARRGRSA